jgi:protein-S-isoprenylcysteine O-methyltransferase Ste14
MLSIHAKSQKPRDIAQIVQMMVTYRRVGSVDEKFGPAGFRTVLANHKAVKQRVMKHYSTRPFILTVTSAVMVSVIMVATLWATAAMGQSRSNRSRPGAGRPEGRFKHAS